MLPPATRRALAVLAVILGSGCNSAPSRPEALQALREATPELDTATAYVRVWQDGPPWFSCAEVIAKLGGPTDSTVVRDQVGNWRPLVLAGWLMLRDTSYRLVNDPGWCAAKLTSVAAQRAQGWQPVAEDSFPTGSARRGWRVPIGHRQIGVPGSPRAIGHDSATVEYVTTIATNANGTALRADRDSARGVALLRRVDGRWRVAQQMTVSARALHPTPTGF
jgi:hypothetical protein